MDNPLVQFICGMIIYICILIIVFVGMYIIGHLEDFY